MGFDFDDEDNEVVQLKFLQKSNQEQMKKLRGMWGLEPFVLHYYLNKFVFPEHMRTQRTKLSASGQSVGGDMLIGRRVGFSGTPSDLLPKEMGACDYEVLSLSPPSLFALYCLSLPPLSLFALY